MCARDIRAKKAFIIFCIMSSAGNGLTGYASASSHPVEIIADGKRYPSLHAYKLKRLQEELRQVLSVGRIREFSQEELCAVMQELKQADVEENPPDTEKEETPPPLTDPTGDFKEGPAEGASGVPDDSDPDTAEMEEMLYDYLNGHKDVSPVVFDPRKVKTILIKPSQKTMGDSSETMR